MTFDNADELVKVAQHYPGAEMILRIVTDDSHSLCRFSSKFGAPLRTVPGILAAAAKLGVSVVGVSFHVGSGCADAAAFAAAARDALAVFAMGKDYGFEMSVLDIGGRLPGRRQGGAAARARRRAPAPGARAVPARHALHRRARALLCRALPHARREHPQPPPPHRRRHRPRPRGPLLHQRRRLPQLNCIFFDHQHPAPAHPPPPGAPSSAARPVVPSTVFGPTCDSLDCVCKDVPMPLLDVGDWLFFPDMAPTPPPP